MTSKDFGYLVKVWLPEEAALEVVNINKSAWYDYDLYPSEKDAKEVCAELVLMQYECKYEYVTDWIEPDYFLCIDASSLMAYDKGANNE